MRERDREVGPYMRERDLEVGPYMAFFAGLIPPFLVCLFVIGVISLIYLAMGKSTEEQNNLWIAGSLSATCLSISIAMITSASASKKRKEQQKRR